MNKNKNRIYSPDGKNCIDCLVSLTKDNTNTYDIKKARYLCKKCQKSRSQQKYINRKELIREQQRIYDLSVKIKIIEAYGGKCVCCGEDALEFLTIDHINNDVAEDRRLNGKKSGGKLYRWLIKTGFPKDEYQLLCYNCNCSEGFFGYCPHNKPEIVIRPTRPARPARPAKIVEKQAG